jgi:hypothetical protein
MEKKIDNLVNVFICYKNINEPPLSRVLNLTHESKKLNHNELLVLNH